MNSGIYQILEEKYRLITKDSNIKIEEEADMGIQHNIEKAEVSKNLTVNAMAVGIIYMYLCIYPLHLLIMAVTLQHTFRLKFLLGWQNLDKFNTTLVGRILRRISER